MRRESAHKEAQTGRESRGNEGATEGEWRERERKREREKQQRSEKVTHTGEAFLKNATRFFFRHQHWYEKGRRKGRGEGNTQRERERERRDEKKKSTDLFSIKRYLRQWGAELAEREGEAV